MKTLLLNLLALPIGLGLLTGIGCFLAFLTEAFEHGLPDDHAFFESIGKSALGLFLAVSCHKLLACLRPNKDTYGP